MPLGATVNIAVPELPDSDVWFANAASWKNYWAEIPADVTLDPINTTLYVPVPYDNALQAAAFNVDGTDYIVATKAMFDSLKARLDTLEGSYQDLRSQLKDGSLITNAQ